jgi:hypothetical protein
METAMAQHMTLSLPVTWIPALLLSDDMQAPRHERPALRRWRTDMTYEFGPFTVSDVERGRTFDRCHEGTEYGMPVVLCQDVVLALPEGH